LGLEDEPNVSLSEETSCGTPTALFANGISCIAMFIIATENNIEKLY